MNGITFSCDRKIGQNRSLSIIYLSFFSYTYIYTINSLFCNFTLKLPKFSTKSSPVHCHSALHPTQKQHNKIYKHEIKGNITRLPNFLKNSHQTRWATDGWEVIRPDHISFSGAISACGSQQRWLEAPLVTFLCKRRFEKIGGWMETIHTHLKTRVFRCIVDAFQDLFQVGVGDFWRRLRLTLVKPCESLCCLMPNPPKKDCKYLLNASFRSPVFSNCNSFQGPDHIWIILGLTFLFKKLFQTKMPKLFERPWSCFSSYHCIRCEAKPKGSLEQICGIKWGRTGEVIQLFKKTKVY